MGEGRASGRGLGKDTGSFLPLTFFAGGGHGCHLQHVRVTLFSAVEKRHAPSPGHSEGFAGRRYFQQSLEVARGACVV